jgi:hypothetical protein
LWAAPCTTAAGAQGLGADAGCGANVSSADGACAVFVYSVCVYVYVWCVFIEYVAKGSSSANGLGTTPAAVAAASSSSRCRSAGLAHLVPCRVLHSPTHSTDNIVNGLGRLDSRLRLCGVATVAACHPACPAYGGCCAVYGSPGAAPTQAQPASLQTMMCGTGHDNLRCTFAVPCALHCPLPPMSVCPTPHDSYPPEYPPPTSPMSPPPPTHTPHRPLPPRRPRRRWRAWVRA